MAISPVGNVTYINQNAQASSIQQANAITRSDMTHIINQEFQDKLKDIQEVRPTPNAHAIDADAKDKEKSPQHHQNPNSSAQDPKEESSQSHPAQSQHLLDIKV
ncbi:hypothetical protein BKH46_03900 [Helicobacter sp. 12S02634-8]|uniref:hypothetical protein n=1 Tax=Helicobacter sp. 12S02634-8 TaxID=1476199 RepID=UPI000BA5709E|nr:hypothetical protein [Helicobacter sp. 12S02634-8]PAF47576.1 hypothetical protein BKH46_03900 [Helicobacter sp. 12S02634-8]